jgi:phosphomannomutase
MDWGKLQNGSDIRGVAMTGVEGENVNFGPQIVERLGKAFVLWLMNAGHYNIKIAFGMDSRISGPELKNSFIKGATSMSADVYDCGLASTPAMFMTTKSEKIKATAGVMLTASHLPFNRNGLKFFTEKGGLDKKDITEILELAETGKLTKSAQGGEVFQTCFIDEYSESLVNYIRNGAKSDSEYEKPLRGLKIIVDAGNGAGGFFAEKVLSRLGANTKGSQFLKPDGHFPNHIPNPENEEAMKSICLAVVNEKADLGVIFDTDVDRAAVVDRKGNPINRNQLIALISAVVLREHPGSIIVTDSITSDGLTKFIEDDHNGIHHRFKRGYKNVINEAIRLNSEGKESWLAIETSGHAALKENYFLDDGAYLVAKLLVEMAILKTHNQDLTDLIKGLGVPVESKEYRFSILEENFVEYGKEVIQNLTEKAALVEGWEIVEPNFEGLRVKCTRNNEKGWFLLRLSLHDPVMPMNAESDIDGGVESILKILSDLLQPFDGIDISSILQ